MNALDLAVYDDIRGALAKFPAIKTDHMEPTATGMFSALSQMYSPGVPQEVTARNNWRKEVKKLRAEFCETRFKVESNLRHVLDTTDLIDKTIMILNELIIVFEQAHLGTDGLLHAIGQYEEHHY